MKIKAAHSCDSVLLVAININPPKKTKIWPLFAWFRAAVGKSSPRGPDSSRVFTGKQTSAPTSLGKSIFCLVGHQTQLEPGSRGLDRDILNPIKWILHTSPSWGTYNMSTNTLVKEREPLLHLACFYSYIHTNSDSDTN